jgi:hypothetical protein
MIAATNVGDIEIFVGLLGVACKDDGIYQTLEKILALPDQQRKGVLMALINDMRAQGAPDEFVSAFECLYDDEVAERAYEVIFKCHKV